jgi:hypothetical protein
MSKYLYVLSVAAVLLLVGVAVADNPMAPLKIPEPEQFTRVGGSVYGKRVITTTGDSYLYTPATPTVHGAYAGIIDLRLVAWNTPVTATCAADTILCWTQTATLTVSTTSNLVGSITDANGPDGPGACFFAPAGIPVTDMPMRQMFSSSNDIGARSGVCIAGTTAISNSWPCRVDGDCPSSATCSTAGLNGVSPKARQSGAFLMLQSPGGASYCFVSESN